MLGDDLPDSYSAFYPGLPEEVRYEKAARALWESVNASPEACTRPTTIRVPVQRGDRSMSSVLSVVNTDIA